MWRYLSDKFAAGRGSGVQLERDVPDPHLVAGLEAGVPKRLEHPDLAQALLEIRERLVIREVVTRDQDLYPASGDPERAVLALHLEAADAGRRVHAVLRLESRGRRRRHLVLLDRDGVEDRMPQLVDPGAGRGRRREHPEHAP